MQRQRVERQVGGLDKDIAIPFSRGSEAHPSAVSFPSHHTMASSDHEHSGDEDWLVVDTCCRKMSDMGIAASEDDPARVAEDEHPVGEDADMDEHPDAEEHVAAEDANMDEHAAAEDANMEDHLEAEDANMEEHAGPHEATPVEIFGEMGTRCICKVQQRVGDVQGAS